MSETAVWIQVTMEMPDSQEAMILFCCTLRRTSQHRPLSGSLTAKHTWRNMAYTYTKKEMEIIAWLQSRSYEDSDNCFWLFIFFTFLSARHDAALPYLMRQVSRLPFCTEIKEANTFLKGRKGQSKTLRRAQENVIHSKVYINGVGHFSRWHNEKIH